MLRHLLVEEEVQIYDTQTFFRASLKVWEAKGRNGNICNKRERNSLNKVDGCLVYVLEEWRKESTTRVVGSKDAMCRGRKKLGGEERTRDQAALLSLIERPKKRTLITVRLHDSTP